MLGVTTDSLREDGISGLLLYKLKQITWKKRNRSKNLLLGHRGTMMIFFFKKRKVGAKFPIWNYGSKNVMRAYFLLQSAWLSEVTLVLPSYFVLLTDQLSGIFRA